MLEGSTYASSRIPSSRGLGRSTQETARESSAVAIGNTTGQFMGSGGTQAWYWSARVGEELLLLDACGHHNVHLNAGQVDHFPDVPC
jgi:hypothetical protein